MAIATASPIAYIDNPSVTNIDTHNSVQARGIDNSSDPRWNIGAGNDDHDDIAIPLDVADTNEEKNPRSVATSALSATARILQPLPAAAPALPAAAGPIAYQPISRCKSAVLTAIGTGLIIAGGACMITWSNLSQDNQNSMRGLLLAGAVTLPIGFPFVLHALMWSRT